MAVIYFVRHGRHKGNVLTAEGVANMNYAARLIECDQPADGVKRPFLIGSSQEPRAVMGSGVIAACLGIKVTLGTIEAINPAEQLGAAIKAGNLPSPGEGCIRAWREQCPVGVEMYEGVVKRVQQWAFRHDPKYNYIVVTHGGVIEPAVADLSGGDDHDLAEGEVAVLTIWTDRRLSVRYKR